LPSSSSYESIRAIELGAELFQKRSPTHPMKKSLHVKAFLLQVLEVYPFPRDKPAFRKSLKGVFNVVDGGDARGLILPRRCHY